MGRVLALIILFFIFPQEKSWGQGDVNVWNSRPESERTNELDPPPGELNEDPDVMAAEKLRKNAAKDPNAMLGQEIDKNLIELQAAINGDVSAFSILRDPKMRESLRKIFENNPLQIVPDSILKENLEKSNFAGVFKKFPILMSFMTNFMKHPTAFSQLLKILDRRESVRTCGIISVLLLILLIYLKRKLISPKIVWRRRFLISQWFNVIGIFTLLIIYSATFSKELAPTYQVIKQTLFS